MRILAVLLLAVGWNFVLLNVGFSNGCELFVKSCQFQGMNPQLIKTGLVSFELTIKTPPVSEELIQEEIKKQKEMFTNVANSSMPQLKEHLEKLLPNVERGVRNRFTANKKMKGKVLFRGNSTSEGFRKYEISRLELGTSKWSEPTLVIRKIFPKIQGDNVLWEPDLHTAQVTDIPFSLDDPQYFGRLYGVSVMPMTALLLDGSDPERFQFSPNGISTFEKKYGSLIRSSGTKQYDENALATVIEWVNNDIVTQRYWIDASRGYVCPLIQFYDEKSGKLIEERISKNYFLHKKTGLWYPAYHEHSVFEADTGTLREKREYRIDRASFNINQGIALDEFAIDIPMMTDVLDVRGGSRVSFKADKAGVLALTPGGLELTKLDWLRKVGDLPVLQSNTKYSSVRMFFVFTGAVLIFLGLFFKWKEWRKKL